jgi:hypothetical protein
MPKRGKSRGTTKRIVAKRTDSTVFEEAKGLMCIRGTKTTDELRCVLRDLAILTKPHSKMFMRRNMVRPFEDAASIEFLSDRNGMGLFALASHSKKRPFNLVFGRCFANSLLDMVEVGLTGAGVLSMKPDASEVSKHDTDAADDAEAEDEAAEATAKTAKAASAKAAVADDDDDDEEEEEEAETEAGEEEAAASSASASTAEPGYVAPTPQIGARPCMVFQGANWESKPELRTLRSILLDVFRGVPARPGDGVLLSSVSWCISVTEGLDGAIHLRTYTVDMRRSGIRTPKIVLLDMGFHLDMSVRRHHAPDPAMLKDALMIPPQARQGGKKNITRDAIGDKYGRVHMERQDFRSLKLRATKASKADRKGRRSEPTDSSAVASEAAPSKRVKPADRA